MGDGRILLRRRADDSAMLRVVCTHSLEAYLLVSWCHSSLVLYTYYACVICALRANALREYVRTNVRTV